MCFPLVGGLSYNIIVLYSLNIIYPCVQDMQRKYSQRAVLQMRFDALLAPGWIAKHLQALYYNKCMMVSVVTYYSVSTINIFIDSAVNIRQAS